MIKKLKSINNTLGNKYMHNGIYVPRVTEIISKMIHEDYLLYWANSLGFKRKKYKEELELAASKGTLAHSEIEEHLNTAIPEVPLEKYTQNTESYTHPNLPKPKSFGYLSFVKWYEDISINNKVEILGTEEEMTCQYFGGTYDLILSINDKIYLVDFKTSNNISYKHFLQLAAYIYMINNIKKYVIDGCIILQVSKSDVSYNEFVIDFSIKEHYEFLKHCSETFLSLVYGYYNIHSVEQLYKKIFK